jgi:fructose-specific phosphotransferase system IIC component
MRKYPAIEFVAMHGRKLALVAGFVFGSIGIASGLMAGAITTIFYGLVAGLTTAMVLRVAVEVVEVVADTLLPR